MASNLTIATRDIYKSTCRRMLAFQMPVLDRLLKYKKVKPGGLKMSQTVESVNDDSLVTEPGPNDALPGGSKDILDHVSFSIGTIHHPIERTWDEKAMNYKPGDWQLVSLAKKIVQSSIMAVRIKMAKRLHGCAFDNEHDTYHTYVQGIGSACNPGATYGTIDRSDSSKAFWQPFTATDDAYKASVTLSRNWLREAFDKAEYYANGSGPIVAIMGTSLYRALKEEFESFHIYKPTGSRAAQGFESMELDGYEIMEDPFLDSLSIDSVKHKDGTSACLLGEVSGVSYTGKNVVEIINLGTWEYRYVPGVSVDGRGIDDEMMGEITEFFDQSKVIGGRRKDLARIFVDGNFCCEQPNINGMYINVH